jgi:hypothetical protein
MKRIQLHHIAYSDQTAAEMPEGYFLLDNRQDNRHDWREYWPIRSYLLSSELDPESYYGFFSPKFASKTGLSHQGVVDFIDAAPAGTDVFTFSPQPDMGSFFLNVFEQNDLFDPGFTAAADAYLASLPHPRLAGSVGALVMDSRQVVFSNFIVAKPAFWTAWLALTEPMFAICEGSDSALKTALVHATTYTGAVERKVFMIERMASLLLTLEPHWRVKAYDTFRCAWSATRLGEQKLDAVISDALKVAMREIGHPEYTEAFSQLRARLRR